MSPLLPKPCTQEDLSDLTPECQTVHPTLDWNHLTFPLIHSDSRGRRGLVIPVLQELEVFKEGLAVDRDESVPGIPQHDLRPGFLPCARPSDKGPARLLKLDLNGEGGLPGDGNRVSVIGHSLPSNT